MKRLLILLTGIVLLFACMCSKDNKEYQVIQSIIISILCTGPGYEGTYYPDNLQVTSDYAIWIEDADHNYIKTLKITPVAVTVDSAHGSHIEHLPGWMETSGLTYSDLAAETANGIAPSFDGRTGASPYFESNTDEQTLTAVWDLSDANGDLVTGTTYYGVVEVANIIKDGDMGSGATERFEVHSETLSTSIDLNTQTGSCNDFTEHIQEISVEFSTQSSLEKTITGP